MKSILKIVPIVLGVLLLAPPSVSFAAYDDVSLQTADTLISVGGATFTVAGPGGAIADSIVVDSNTLDVTMTAHSFFKITTTDRRTISTTDIAPVTLESSCTDSLATYTFTSPANATTRTFTVTVNADTCTTGGTPGGSGGGGGGSSGGGGGSSGYVYIPPPAEPTSGATPPVPAVSVVVPVTTAVSSTPALPVITALLNLGKKNADVLTLQKILNSDSDTQIATSGAGSPGNETDYFGPATLKAVKAFQEKYGIAGPGEVGYGNVGPKTRVKLNSISSGTTGDPSSAASGSTSSLSSFGTVPAMSAVGIGSILTGLAPGMSNASVKILQKILNSDSDTQIAVSGAGSPGNETNYFGPATLKAVKAFQEKYGIAGPGEVGYGNVGPKTRAKLNSISSGTTATSPQTGTAEATIQKQIDDAMNQILLLQEQLKTAQ